IHTYTVLANLLARLGQNSNAAAAIQHAATHCITSLRDPALSSAQRADLLNMLEEHKTMLWRLGHAHEAVSITEELATFDI
ncbi:MAG: hypothetical protein ACRDJN_23710, partial [Chloroflexota bacterium]